MTETLALRSAPIRYVLFDWWRAPVVKGVDFVAKARTDAHAGDHYALARILLSSDHQCTCARADGQAESSSQF